MLKDLNEKIIELQNKIEADILFYYGDIAKDPVHPKSQISVEDVEAMYKRSLQMRPRDEVYLVLQVEGGPSDACFIFIEYLRKFYKKINVVISTYAKSAGSILALSSDCLYMDSDAALSDFRPQYDVADYGLTEKSDIKEIIATQGKLISEHATFTFEKLQEGKLLQGLEPALLRKVIDVFWNPAFDKTQAHGTTIDFDEAVALIPNIKSNKDLSFCDELEEIAIQVGSILYYYDLRKIIFHLDSVSKYSK